MPYYCNTGTSFSFACIIVGTVTYEERREREGETGGRGRLVGGQQEILIFRVPVWYSHYTSAVLKYSTRGVSVKTGKLFSADPV